MKKTEYFEIFCKHQVLSKIPGEIHCIGRLEKNLPSTCIYTIKDLAYDKKIICEKKIYLSRLKEPIKNKCENLDILNERLAYSLMDYFNLKPSK